MDHVSIKVQMSPSSDAELTSQKRSFGFSCRNVKFFRVFYMTEQTAHKK